MPTPEQNAETAVRFLTTALVERNPRLAVEKYVGATYTQHNPNVEDGPEGFIQTVLDYIDGHGDLQYDIKRVIATEEYVVVHDHGHRPGSDEGIAVIDIFRVDADGRLVEHWDVVMPVSEVIDPKNSNGYF